ncbi:MAG: arsenite methyltransferase [Bacteroidetes bacterium]|nr:arsenite methyltransferase [Bacteroidota bacterium]
MNDEQGIKKIVKEKYSEIAMQQKVKNDSPCCRSNCGCSNKVDFSILKDEYKNLPGYIPDADLSLGCGLPTEFAKIKPGDIVVDLGSGAGNDCFVARSIVGETGRVIGIDMTEAMITKAQENALKYGFKNIEFKLGEIENIPIDNETADVVVSNCVMNLVPNKRKAFAETFRILKSGGHFSISDIVLRGRLPEKFQKEAQLYVECISGAIQKNEYLGIVEETGFVNIKIQKETKVDIPNELLAEYLTPELFEEYNESKVGIYSITVYAEKPLSVNSPTKSSIV